MFFLNYFILYYIFIYNVYRVSVKFSKQNAYSYVLFISLHHYFLCSSRLAVKFSKLYFYLQYYFTPLYIITIIIGCLSNSLSSMPHQTSTLKHQTSMSRTRLVSTDNVECCYIVVILIVIIILLYIISIEIEIDIDIDIYIEKYVISK